MKVVAGLALAAAIAVAGVAANLYLLGVGGVNADPVGRLTPRSVSTLPTAPATTTDQPTTTDDDRDHTTGHDGDDDD